MNHKSVLRRGLAALLALLIMMTSVPMTNVFASEMDGSESSVEMSVEESAISTSFDQEMVPEESAEIIELPDETGASSEEENTDPARAGPELETAESSDETEMTMEESAEMQETETEKSAETGKIPEETVEDTVEESVEVFVEVLAETESDSETAAETMELSEEESEAVTTETVQENSADAAFTPDLTFNYASYDAFASEKAGVALTRTEQQIQFFNTWVDQSNVSAGATIDSLFGADNENYSAEYLLSLNPNQFTETTPVYIGADGNYYVVSAAQSLNGTESVDYQPATAFYNGISEAFTDIEYLGSGVYRIPAQRAEYCFSEHYYTDDAAGTIIGVTFGLRIQQLFGYNAAESAERTIAADVLYPDATEQIRPATVNLNSGTVTVKFYPDDSEVDLSSGYNLAAVINKGEATPSGLQLTDGGKTAVFSVGDARAVGCMDIAIAYQAPAVTDVAMGAQTRALKTAAPAKAALRGAASGSYGMYDSNYAEVDPDQLPSDLAVGDMFYFSTRLHVAGVYDNYDGGGNLHIGANSIPTHEAQSFTYYNELADWTVIKNWFVTKLSDASSPDPDTVAPGVMRQMTEANMLARAANNGTSVNLSGAHIFGYVSDPLGSNTTNGKTLNLSGISIAIGCMHAWAYMGSTAPADVVASIYQFTGTNSWAPQQSYGFFEPVVAMQCTEIRKSGNTTYATFKVVTQMLEIGNLQNPANYQCGFATLRLAYEKEDTGYAKIVKSSGNTDVTSGNACYSLIGAEYTIYSDNVCTTVAKTTSGSNAILTVQDEQGNTNTVDLEAGSYWVKETKAGKGYILDEGKYPVTVEAGKTTSVPVKDVPGLDPVNIILSKRDSSTGTAQGAARLEGAEYTVKYYDNQTGTGTPKRTWGFKTNADGLIRYSDSFKVSGDALYTGTSGYVGMPIGTVTIQETKAPEGYILNSETYTVHFTQKADGSVRSDKGAWNTTNQAEDLTIVSEESPVLAGIQVKKQDKDSGTSQGDADLSGIEFTIRNANGKTVNIGGRNYENNAVILTITTDGNGTAKTSVNALPVGKYTVQETQTNASYVLTDGAARTVVIGNADNGKLVAVDQSGEDLSYRNTVIKGGVKVLKYDKENGAVPQGDADFSGIQFEVRNASAKAVKISGNDYAVGSVVLTLTADAAGSAQSDPVLPYGTYTIQEVSGNNAYLMTDGSKYEFKIRKDGEIVTGTVEDNAIVFEDIVVKGGIKVTKKDAELNASEAQGDGSLKGIKFAVVNDSDRTVKVNGVDYGKGYVVEVFTLDESGQAATADSILPYGSYTVYELRKDSGVVRGVKYADAPKGASTYANDSYLFKANTKTLQVYENGKLFEAAFDNAPVRGGVKIEKWDKDLQKKVAQGDADFNGIKFEITNQSAKAVKVNGTLYAKGKVVYTMTTNAAGDAQTAADLLPYGTYTIQEVTTNGSYLLTDGTARTFRIRENGEIVSTSTTNNSLAFINSVDKGNVSISKTDANGLNPQGDGALSGIKFAVVNRSKNLVYYNGTEYASGKVIDILLTDENGNCSTPDRSLPYGTYEIIELREDSRITKGDIYNNSADKYGTSIYANKTGYLFAANRETVTIRVDSETKTVSFKDEILRGEVKIEKWDAEKNAKTAQGDADFNGIRFTIKNASKNPVYVNGKTYAAGDVVTTITTNAAGDAETGQILPYGTYMIQETETNGSYLLTDGTVRTFKIRTDGEIVTTSTAGNSLVFKDKVERGGVKVGKIDRENDRNEAQGWATLEGAEFTIYNNSKQAVIVEGTAYNRGSAVKVLISGEDGTAESAADLLPYGTYYVKETKAPEGYLLNTKWRVDFQIRDDGDIVDITKDPKIERTEDRSGWFSVTGGSETNPAEVPDDIKRADLRFAKYDIDGRKMAGIPFLISRLDREGNVVESHVVVTDEDGELSTRNLSKTDDKVNSLDSYVKDGVFTDDSKLDASVGVWFGEQSAQDDSKGALIYANYRITELSCKANEGQDLLSEDLFPEKDAEDLVNVFENNHVYDLENVFIDLIIHPESDLIDETTESKTVTLGNKVKVVDTVRYDHLKVSRRYKIETEIIYVSRDGNETISLGTGEKEFYPEKVDATDTANGIIFCEVEINTAGLNGGTLHAIDTFYVRAESGWVKLVTHNEKLDDERQTLFVPYMETTAADAKTNDHVGTIEKEAEIIDIVSYENLANDRMYMLVGTLRYADTGEIVKGSDGNDCVVEAALRISYRAKDVTEKSYGYLGPKDGEIRMPAFKFDASEMAGRTLVVTENLYDYDTDELIISHEELTDEKQSVHFLKVETEAADSKTGTRTSTVGEKETIIDEVTLTNTIPGMEYIVTGDLVYQADCVDAEGVSHKQGEVIAVHEPVTITAKSAKEVVELRYEVDSSALEGISGVVFEDVWHKEIKVAAHHDYDSKPQTPHWPKVRTSAVDGATGTKTGVVGDTATIVDTVSLTNLNIGDTYKVSGILMQADETVFTVNGKEVVAESSEFKADQSEMTVEIIFTFDSSSLAGKSLVVFEKLFCNDVDVARHEDLTDKDQTVDYPEGYTNASDKKTGDEVGTVGEKETIIDTVTYKNLHIGDTYTIHGDLHYKEDFTDQNGVKHKAGDSVKDESGTTITSSVTFTAEKKNGTIDLVYNVNSELLRGASVVVFEDFEVNKVLVYSHADLDDEDQRVDYPEVKTSAADARTEDHVGSVGTMKLIDTVELTNLTIGKEYRVTGILMDKESGEPLLDEEGNDITSESEVFIATEKDMEIEMTFEAAVEALAGKTKVVFEDLIHNDITVSYHHDIDDEEQSVHFPEIGTTALADETGDHVVGADEEVTITDTVHYRNLLADGREYTVSGVLVDKATGNPILIDGEEITAEEIFVPEETEGDVEIVFTFDASALAGTTLVAFEKVAYKDIEVAVHADIDDEDQTVYIPEIRTQAYDENTRIDHSKAESKVTLYDQVSFTNLLPERDYVMKGYLVDKLTGEPILINGRRVEAEKEFWAESESGVVIMEFTFDATLITPEPIVVFESLYYKDIEIAVHADVEDEEQSDYIPEIGTTAISGDTEDHITNADEEVTIIDTVSYRGLKPNTKYEVTGILMDKESGEALLDADGKEITSSVTFVTGDTEENEVWADGEVKVTFTFDGSNLSGRTAVVFETLYRDGKEVAVHADLEDSEQTIHFPDAKTTATDKATENHTAHLGEEVVIEDLVKYRNLIPRKTYTVKGTLMVKETGEPLLDEDGDPITAEKEFKAENSDGEILLSFIADITKLVGKSIVVFENLQLEGITVVLHADLEDEDQTVVVPEIQTTAFDKASGGKTMTLGKEVTLVDTVSFTGLTPGEEYILKGRVIDKATGEVLVQNGKEITKEQKFTPEEAEGSVEIEFTINTLELQEHELVVFEKLYDRKNNLIAEHEDLEDQDQMVTVPKKPDEPDIPPQILGIHPGNKGMYLIMLLAVSGLTGVMLVILKKKQHNR